VAADLARELVTAVVRYRDEIGRLINRTAPRHPVTSLAKMGPRAAPIGHR
jgi:hypothetical protein